MNTTATETATVAAPMQWSVELRAICANPECRGDIRATVKRDGTGNFPWHHAETGYEACPTK